MKLGLGTAQFGLDYGVSNRSGKTPASEVAAILREARAHGIEVLDTAPSYGDSEAAIGQALAGSDRFRIVTKTPAFNGRPVAPGDVQHLRETFGQSLERLGVARVYGLLVHHAEDLLAANGGALFDAATALKREGLVTKIGSSVYNAQDIDALLAKFPIDLIQLPVSVFDQRLVASGHLQELKARGIEIHARSVFLQGLLLMSPEALSEGFQPLSGHLAAYGEFLHGQGVSAVEAALGFALGLPEVDVVICGVNDLRQFQELIAASGTQLELGDYLAFGLSDPDILDPSRWSR